MALLTERQQTAGALMCELQRLGAWVTSALPLRDDEKLKFQVLDENRSQVLEKLSQWGWGPTLCSNLPRITSRGMEAATIYEIDLPRERTPVVDDRLHVDEIAEQKKTSVEVEAMRRYLGLDK
jgi:hypothetical protein